MEKRYRRLTDLIELTRMLQESYCGFTVERIAERFAVSRRTAERMLGVLREVYPGLETQVRNGLKYWRLPQDALPAHPPFEDAVAGDRDRVELDEERAIAEQVLAESPVGMILIDPGGSIAWANPALESFFGIEAGAMIGRDECEFMELDLRPMLVDADSFISPILASHEEATCVEHLIGHVRPGTGREERMLEYWSWRILDGPFAGGWVEHYLDVTQSCRARAGIDRSHRAIARARLIEKMISELETGQRGYLIAGKPEFLVPYLAAKELLAENVLSLRELMRGDAKQLERLDQLEALLADWHRRAGEPEIEIRRRVAETRRDEEPLRRLLAEGLGARILMQLRQALAGVESELECECICGRLPNSKFTALALRNDLVEMEAAQRGFLVTGREQFVEQLETARASLKLHLAELREASPVELERRIEALGMLGDRWFAEAAAPEIEAHRQRDVLAPTLEDVTRVIQAGVGKGLMDRMRALLHGFLEHEHELLAAREAAADVRRNNDNSSPATSAP